MNKLIKDAEESGFKSYRFSVEQRLKEFGNETTFYLWMCELNKWLIDTHNIIVTFEISGAGIFPDIITFDETPFKIRTIDYSLPIEEMDECLKIGLIEAIKLLK